MAPMSPAAPVTSIGLPCAGLIDIVIPFSGRFFVAADRVRKPGSRLCGGGAAGVPPLISYRSAKRTERGPQFVGEELRLLPGGEVAALVDLVPVDEAAAPSYPIAGC
jgi:hypothetical protein